MVYETALVRPIRIVATKGLNQPWSMAFLPDGGILVTERPGRLRMVRNGVLDPNPIAGLPNDIQAQGLAGLMDVQLHPKFADNKLVYITYHKKAAPAPGAATPPAGGRGGGPAGTITLARARWDGTKLVDVKDLFSAIPTGNASRIVFGRDGMIYMSVGYGDPPQANQGNPDPDHMPPQDPNNLAGKTLRLKDDGTVPPDNPFVGRAGYRPEIYTMGHRNILGLAVHPTTGAIWSVENGPNGGDEVNELAPGKNYGWPIIGNGRFYLGPRVSVDPYRTGMEPPVGLLGPGDRAVRPDVLHRRQIPAVEQQSVCRRHAAGRSAALGSSRTHRLQRQMGRAAPRVDAARASESRARRPTGPGRFPVRVDCGKRRRLAEDRTRHSLAGKITRSGRLQPAVDVRLKADATGAPLPPRDDGVIPIRQHTFVELVGVRVDDGGDLDEGRIAGGGRRDVRQAILLVDRLAELHVDG